MSATRPIRNKFAAVIKRKGKIQFQILAVLVFFVVLGVAASLLTRAATPYVSVESEQGTTSGCATKVPDSSASGGSAVKFGTGCDGGGGDTTAAGAHLPISYDLSSLTGSIHYVATNGSDSNAGTASAPYATLSKAVSASASNDTIVVRGGTYRNQGKLTIASSKTLKVVAYPGEIPVFNGAQVVDSGSWTTDGSYRYISYTPRPVTDGSGISFSTGQNLTGDGVGKYPDQAWIGNTQLQQVSAKASLVNGTFWVDQSSKRLYLTSADAAKSGIEVSQQATFLSIQSANTSLEGLRVTRYSNTASDYGVIKVYATANKSMIRNLELSDSAFSSLMYVSSRNDGSTLKNVTVTTGNWMGVDDDTTDNLTLDSVKISNMNQFNEFSFSPQSGAFKTSRSLNTKVINSEITDNNSHALWFDQSNYNVIVANNVITGNKGSSVFFEISDNLLLINNYIQSTSTGQPVKLSGSSGLKLVNNTIVGGSDPIGIYTDSRSKAGCADPSKPLCSGSYGSDRDTVRPYRTTMDWMPRLDLMINNIVAYPTKSSLCGAITPVCITQSNSSASAPIQTEIHKADSSRGIPQTYINGNVYANGTSRIWTIASPSANYTTHTAFASAMAGSPVSISGFEAAGRTGNSYVNADGSPASALTAVHSQAYPVPSDSVINLYIPAGTRHYGVLTK